VHHYQTGHRPPSLLGMLQQSTVKPHIFMGDTAYRTLNTRDVMESQNTNSSRLYSCSCESQTSLYHCQGEFLHIAAFGNKHYKRLGWRVRAKTSIQQNFAVRFLESKLCIDFGNLMTELQAEKSTKCLFKR